VLLILPIPKKGDKYRGRELRPLGWGNSSFRLETHLPLSLIPTLRCFGVYKLLEWVRPVQEETFSVHLIISFYFHSSPIYHVNQTTRKIFPRFWGSSITECRTRYRQLGLWSICLRRVNFAAWQVKFTYLLYLICLRSSKVLSHRVWLYLDKYKLLVIFKDI
jgi:hypothetical protein